MNVLNFFGTYIDRLTEFKVIVFYSFCFFENFLFLGSDVKFLLGELEYFLLTDTSFSFFLSRMCGDVQKVHPCGQFVLPYVVLR